MRRDEERRGCGTAMVEYVRRLSAASGASLLVVISNGSAFWLRPALRLGELAPAEAARFPCFVPWSHGIKLLGSRGEARGEAERSVGASLVREAPLVPRPQLRQPAFEDEGGMPVEAEAVEEVEAVAVGADAVMWEGEQEAVVVDEEQPEAALAMEAPALQPPAKRPRRAAEAKAQGADTGGAARGRRGVATTTTTGTTAANATAAAAAAAAAADADADADADAEQTWVQCEDCEKWRRVRGGQPTPRRWRCRDNRDDARHASCSVPQAIGSRVVVGTVMAGRAILLSPLSPHLSASQCISVHLDASRCISMYLCVSRCRS